MRREGGFTLLEVLLSVAIIGILVGLSMPIYQTFEARNDLDTTTQGLANSLRRAQVYARSGSEDSTWGVHIVSGGATLFKGSSYASRNTSFDETTDIPTTFGVSGLGDIIFSKLTGTPSSTGSITLTGTSNDVKTVTINGKGMVSY